MSTRAVLSADSTGARYVAGHLAPLLNEVTAVDLDVVGTVPAALSGRFLRTGPNPVEEPDTDWVRHHHWYSGNGMVHGLRLHEGRALWFRSRFIVDRTVARIRGRAPIPGPGVGRRDGPVNTNVAIVGGKLVAIVEAGNLPVELDDGLESVRRTDFDGTLEAGFSATPTSIRAPANRSPWPTRRPLRSAASASAAMAGPARWHDLPHVPMIHDMAFSESFVIVPDFPVTFQPHNAHTALPWLWDEQRPSRIGLLPRRGDGSDVQWFDAPRCFAFHFPNAWDDGDLTIVDLCKHPSMFRTDQNGPNEGAPVLARWTLNRVTGRLSETVIDDRGIDFPRINPGRYSQSYRYLYSAHWGDNLQFGPAFKHDLQRGICSVHDYGPGRMTTEPVFVARPDAVAEDEGWILSSVYDPQTHRSDIVILDAQDFAGEPVAIIRLPVRIPFTFHGGWVPDGTTR